MLTLIHEVKPDVSVIYLRGFEHPTKHLFAGGIIQDWGLNVREMMPSSFDVVAKGAHVELIEIYEIVPSVHLYFPLEAEPDHVPGPDSYCAIEKLNEPVNVKPYSFDAIFIGHRSEDIDPIYGAIPLKDFVVQVGELRAVYPLKDFTEADVWNASALLGVPQNALRYKRGLMSENPDYFPLCTRCLESQEGATVVCPKIGGEVFNLSKFINPEARRENWAQTFVNIKKIQ